MSDAIIICSEARGGSTWLMELLSNIPNSIVNWEPLHVNNGVVNPNLKLGWRPLIKTEDKQKDIKKLFCKILTLKIYNKWTLRHVYFTNLRNSKYVITKFVRINQSLPWLVNQFPDMDHKPIFLLRHPITTSISRLKTFDSHQSIGSFTKNSKRDIFLIPDCINNERYVQNKPYIEKLETSLEREIAIWCMNNANLLNHPDSEKWITLFYEDLVLNPKDEFYSLLKKLNITVSPSILNKIIYRKASASDYNKLLKDNPKNQLESFLEKLESEYLEKIQNIFDHYKILKYSAFDAYPRHPNSK